MDEEKDCQEKDCQNKENTVELDLKVQMPYAIGIVSKLNGWLVSVGCKEFVFTDLTELLRCVGGYMADPVGTVRSFNKANDQKNRLFDAVFAPPTAQDPQQAFTGISSQISTEDSGVRQRFGRVTGAGGRNIPV